jgi:hypothetical protein
MRIHVSGGGIPSVTHASRSGDGGYALWSQVAAGRTPMAAALSAAARAFPTLASKSAADRGSSTASRSRSCGGRMGAMNAWGWWFSVSAGAMPSRVTGWLKRSRTTSGES